MHTRHLPLLGFTTVSRCFVGCLVGSDVDDTFWRSIKTLQTGLPYPAHVFCSKKVPVKVNVTGWTMLHPQSNGSTLPTTATTFLGSEMFIHNHHLVLQAPGLLHQTFLKDCVKTLACRESSIPKNKKPVVVDFTSVGTVTTKHLEKSMVGLLNFCLVLSLCIPSLRLDFL